MKKILIIEASPRNGYSTNIANEVAEILNNDHITEILTLRDLDLLPCRGCCLCLSKGSAFCPHKQDDIKHILNRIMEADGVVVVVPNYSLQVTALLKQVFDRLAFVFHRPRLFRKTSLPIVVQGVYGGGRICKYINEVFGFWGMRTVKGAVVSGGIYPKTPKANNVKNKNQVIINKAIKRFLKQLDCKNPKKPSIFQLMIFRSTRSSMKYFEEALAPDKEYYLKNGWDTSDYYYPVRINPFKKIIGWFFDSMIKNMAKKEKRKA